MHVCLRMDGLAVHLHNLLTAYIKSEAVRWTAASIWSVGLLFQTDMANHLRTFYQSHSLYLPMTLNLHKL
jgi:hypothetical protein